VAAKKRKKSAASRRKKAMAKYYRDLSKITKKILKLEKSS